MIITLPGDLKVITYEPPRGFDPLTADAADLKRYGLPPRPDDPHHLARYEHVAKRLQGKLNYIQPTFQRNDGKAHGPRKRLTGAPTETSTNWSGGVVFAPSGQSFNWVEGDWVIPDVDAPTENQWYYCANWIGIDGDGSNDVCQAGVECDVYRSGTTVTRNIYPWWEWFAQGCCPGTCCEHQITNLAVNPGDMVTVLICTSGVGATGALVIIVNRTTGDSTWFTISAPTGTSLAGNSAEWIVEAPTVGGAQSSMADYGEVFFSVCEAFLGSGATVNGGTGDNINMINSSGSEVSAGTLITPTVIQCEYVGTVP